MTNMQKGIDANYPINPSMVLFGEMKYEKFLFPKFLPTINAIVSGQIVQLNIISGQTCPSLLKKSIGWVSESYGFDIRF